MRKVILFPHKFAVCFLMYILSEFCILTVI